MTPLVNNTKPTSQQYTSDGPQQPVYVSAFDVPQPIDGNGGNQPAPAKPYTKEDFKQDLLVKIQNEIDSKYLADYDLNNKLKFEALLKAFIRDPKKLDDLIAANDTEGIANEINRIVTDIKTALNTGWELEKVINRQNQQGGKRGLSEALAGFSPEIRNKGFENVDQAEQKRAIQAFFKTYFEDKEKELGHEEVVRQQLRTFGRILLNSTEEEKAAFKEVIKNLLSENISPGLKEALSSMDKPELLARSFTAEDTQEIYKTADGLGNYIKEEDLEDVVSTLTQYKDKDSITRDHTVYEQELANFLEENKDILEAIKAKIEEETPLTDEEEAIIRELNYLKRIAAGEMTGTAGNRYMEESEIEEVLTTLNTDNLAHGEDFYRDVIEMANQYVQNHQGELNITTGDFNRLMDETSHNRYSSLLPDAPSNNDNTGSAYDYEYGGFVTISPEAAALAQNNIYNLQEQMQNTEETPLPQIVNNNEDKTPITSTPSTISTYKQLQNYMANSGSAVYNIVTNRVRITYDSLKTHVLDTYQTFSSSYKGILLCQSGDNWFEDIKGKTKNLYSVVSTALATGNKGKDFDRTQTLEEIIKDNKKRNNGTDPTLHMV